MFTCCKFVMIDEYSVVSLGLHFYLLDFVLDMIVTYMGLLLNIFIFGFASLLATHCPFLLPT